MNSRLLSAGVLLLLLTGCRQDTHLLLKVAFPGSDAREQTASLKISAVLPLEESACTALQTGSALPGDAGYEIEDQVEFGYPADGGIPPLKEIGSGRRLFFAEGLDSQGVLILRGCREAEVGQWAAQIVTVILKWVTPPCVPEGAEGPTGDASCEDSKDNDCDGVSDADDPGCRWWNFDYPSRVKLTFENAGGSEDLIDFPVRVSLDSNRIDYARTLDSGEDLRFVDDDGVTILPHQIEVWEETGTSEVWVRVPQIDQVSSADFIWLYFDNPAATDAQDPPAVWEPDHAGVWHLADADDGNGTVLDSTQTGNDGTANGGVVFDTAGTIGSALFFDGVDDYIAFGSNGFSTSSGTVEAWLKLVAIPLTADLRGYVFAHCTTDPTENRTYIYIKDDGAFGTGMGSTLDLDSGSILDLDSWYYLALAWDGANVTGYLNGTPDFGPSAYADLTTVGNVYAMSFDGSIRFLNGILDELRLSGVHRSADWIAAQNLSLTDAFITFGPIESMP